MRRPRFPLLSRLGLPRGGAGRRTAGLLALILALLVLIVGLNEPRPHPMEDQVVPAGPVSEVPYTLTVGIYATNNHALNLEQPSFIGEGYLWMRWGADLQRFLEQTGTDPDELLMLENQVERWDGAELKASERPKQLDDGTFYQIYQYSKKLYIQNLNLRHYPFQTLDLPIVIEPNDQTDQLLFQSLRLIPDMDDSKIGRNIGLPGFVTQGWSFQERRHRYGSDFGLDTARTDVPPNDYSQLVFSVAYKRSIWASIWTMFQPLAVTLAVVILSPGLASNLWEVRLAIPTTVLLTLVFLQQGYKDQLPELPYLTYLDQIYAIAYLITLASFLLYLWGANQLAGSQAAGAENAEPSPQLLAKLDRLDHAFQFWALVALLSMGTLAWFI
ncbi:hypothetical protein NZK32_08015 [Cyanobium sp. FGCU-52]|nr:hypothetical protein [Cyanobium sp. FGCU52]